MSPTSILPKARTALGTKTGEEPQPFRAVVE